MKSNFKILALLAALSVMGVLGCENKVPTGSGAYPSNPTDYTTVADYETAHPADFGAVNPTLLVVGNNPGTTHLLRGGLHTALDWYNDLTLPILCWGTPPAGNSSVGALHMFHAFDDPGDASYPSNQTRIRLKGNGYYDISNFSGVKFIINHTAADDALKRRFSIAIGATLPPDDDTNGYSDNTKRNNFGKDISSTNGTWAQMSVAFSELTQESGYAALPYNSISYYMDEVIWLQWSEGRNNSKGTCHVDYWLDDVVFY